MVIQEPSRRIVLGGVGSLLIAGAGCLSNPQPQAKICTISVQSHLAKPATGQVQVTEASKTVFEKSVQLGTDPKSRGVLIQHPVKDSGQYKISISIVNSTQTVDTTKIIHGRDDSVWVNFIIGQNEVIHHDSGAAQQC